MSREKINSSIPVVDLGELGLGHEEEPSKQEWQRVAEEVVDAFKDTGFVYLTKHGIPEEDIERLVKAGTTFFRLPQHQKDQLKRNPETNGGYVAANQEKLDPNYSYELREAYNIVSNDGMFPDADVPDFRPASAEFIGSCKKLTIRLLTAMALGIKLDRNYFTETHREIFCGKNATTLRLTHYPPIPLDLKPGSIRCGAHTDYGTITLLFQDSNGGLHVRDRGGNWISADPIPGTILVNVGDILQFWTSDKLIATEHRVLIPEDELRRRKSRRSIVLFVHPDSDVLIKPIDGSSNYKPITAKEYLFNKLSQTH